MFALKQLTTVTLLFSLAMPVCLLLYNAMGDIKHLIQMG